MKKKFGGMTLAAMLLFASPSANADNLTGFGKSSSSFVGDFVGDLETGPHSAFAGDGMTQPITNYAPVTIGDLQPTAFQGAVSQVGASCDSGCCDSGSCDGGCDSCCDGPVAGRMKSLLNMCENDGWIRAEGLILFTQDRQAPPLVTTANAGLAPTIGQPSTVTSFGGDLDGGVSAGLRTDIGRYLGNGFGIGGRFLWMSENGDDYSVTANGAAGTQSIGRPYFNIGGGAPIGEGSVEIARANVASGTVNASYATELYGTEGYARFRVCNSRESRIEFIGGYSYFNLEDDLSINDSTTNLGTGTITTHQSLFSTENEFLGGQLGIESQIKRGCWTARMLSKVHLGNMEQSAAISGSTNIRTPPAAGTTTNRSILVHANQGSQTRDEFAFIPEMDLSIGYRFRDHVSFTVGYMFMYFDNVALAGEQIDRYVDITTLGTNVTPAAYTIESGDLWIQGIKIGASIDY